MSFATQRTADLSTFYNTDEHAETITYGGAPIPAIVDYDEGLDENRRGGAVTTYAIIQVKKSDVATVVYRTAVTIDTVAWKVWNTIKGDSDEWTIKLYRGERPVL